MSADTIVDVVFVVFLLRERTVPPRYIGGQASSPREHVEIISTH